MTGAGHHARRIANLASAWLCLCAAAVFFLWASSNPPQDLARVDASLGLYAEALPGGLLAGTAAFIALLIAARLRAGATLIPMTTAASVVYWSALVVLGYAPWPWAVLAATVVAVVSAALRRQAVADNPGATANCLLLHGMGTMAGLYAAINITPCLEGWPALRATAVSLARLLGG